jgi:uncharacterized protein YukE
MARVDIFKMVKSISQESISHPNVDNVAVDATKDIPKNAINEPKPLVTDELPNAEVSNTKTSEPGPENGGGDGTAQTVDVKNATTNMDVSDVNENLNRDQNGGRDIDTLPNKVSATDGLSASDVRTSVEEHAEGEEGGEGTEASDLSSIDSSGAEGVGEADDMVMDLDGEELQVTGMTDVSESKLAECDSVAAKAEALSKATATVERYHGLMQRMHKEGRYMSDELRQSISWALEDIDANLFFTERAALESFNPKARVSLEASAVAVGSGSKAKEGTIDDGADPGEVGKGLGSKLKKLFEAGVKIFMRFVNMVSDLVASFSQDAGKIKNHLGELRKRVNILEGDKEFTMKGAGRLMIGDEFVGDSKNAVAKVHSIAQELLMNWPNALGKILEEWKGKRGMFADIFGGAGEEAMSTIIGGIENNLDRAFRSFDSLQPGDKDKVPSGFLDVDRLHWSGPMPGNMALYAGIKTSKKSGAAGSMEDAADGVNLSFSLIPGGDPSAGDVKATTPTAGEAVAVIRELEKMCQFIVDVKSGNAALKKFVGEAQHSGFMDLFTGNAAGQQAGLIALTLAKTTSESQHRFIGYLINLVKGYIGFLEASIKAEGNDGTIEA